MWYFAWMPGVGFAILFAILNAMWGENEEAREAVFSAPGPGGSADHPEQPRDGPRCQGEPGRAGPVAIVRMLRCLGR